MHTVLTSVVMSLEQVVYVICTLQQADNNKVVFVYFFVTEKLTSFNFLSKFYGIKYYKFVKRDKQFFFISSRVF